MQRRQFATPFRLSDRITDRLNVSADGDNLLASMRLLIEEGLDRLPLPSGGETLERWRVLSQMGARDLSLAKLFEGHTDALAILRELRATVNVPPHSIWGMWAAEPPSARLRAHRRDDGRAQLEGRKAWCSGAEIVSHALVTAWDDDDRQCLVAIELGQASISIDAQPWQAVGMYASGSVDVLFANSTGDFVGAPNAYTQRPGFWHGGIGVAACWYGSASALGDALRAHVARRVEPHAAAHLGAVDVALGQAAAVLREAARAIDEDPIADCEALALRARETVEMSASAVLKHVSRAVGAGPLCRDARIARHAADLPVFMRQSHAERDLENLGNSIAASTGRHWKL